jgi:aromatic-amino-acid transaminase
MSDFSIVAPHAIRQPNDDVIFGMNSRANEAKAKGKDVINATIGALMDDDGDLITLKNVYSIMRSLPDSEFAAYAALKGMPDFIQNIPKAAFRKYIPDAYMDSVATPGGSGAIRQAIWNFSNLYDSVITSDWYWAPYNTLATENLRKIETYEMISKDNISFNTEGFIKKSAEMLKAQKRLLAIINTPAHNPTGFSLSYEEWNNVIDGLRKLAENQDYVISIFVDIAYIDFCTDGIEARKFFKLFTSLPKNIIILTGFSMSKSYTMYGMRCGAITAISSYKENIEAFNNTCTTSGRGNWSNGTRAAMTTMSKIFADDNLLRIVDNERDMYRKMLIDRAAAFDKASQEVGLKAYPYKDGFFISIPCPEPVKVAEMLTKKDLFIVPLKKGLRFAVCSVSEENCRKSPALIKEALDACK